VAQPKLIWQSKLVLLLVVPYLAASVVLQAHWWALQMYPVAVWAVGLSLLLAVVSIKLRAATPAAAVVGAVITASLIFSTTIFPYLPWQTGFIPVLAVAVLTGVVTRIGREKKMRLGIAERAQGRSAAQVAANLGMAALVSDDVAQSLLGATHWIPAAPQSPVPLFAVGLAALAEAAADTVSSELGQVLSSRPRMITTLRLAEPGTDGAVSLAGTLAGTLAAGAVAASGALILRGGLPMLAASWAGGVFGLLFDSLLGATLERRGWLNNDAVNFLSTAAAAAFAIPVLIVLPHFGVG
jgi:uncharacterized protein (TIGR00297 family)